MEVFCRTLDRLDKMTLKDNVLGRGGEGSVYAITNHENPSLPSPENLVAKIYHNPSESNRKAKITAMLRNTPEDITCLAWPLGMIFKENGDFAGYIMKKLSTDKYTEFITLSNPKDRRRSMPNYDLRYAYTTIKNIGTALETIHATNTMLGDINESNIFVGADATILIVDTDSAQITNQKGITFPCEVGKPEYTAPEISHGKLKDNKRTPETDIYAYMIAAYQLLTGGANPTDGSYTGTGEPPNITQKIRDGILPNLKPEQHYKPLKRIPTNALPKPLKQLFLKSFNTNPKERPTLKEITNTLNKIIGNLQQCTRVKNHWYDKTETNECQWCQQPNDPWNPKPPTQTNNQTALPSLTINNSNTFTPPPRKKITTSNQNPAQTNQQGHTTATTSPHTSPNAQASNNQSQQTNEPIRNEDRPKTYRGKTLLEYKDGRYDVRPPLTQLFKTNPKLAIYSIKQELPSAAHIWWNIDNPLANKIGLFIGSTISIIISIAWFFIASLLTPHIHTPLSTETTKLILTIIGTTAAITGIIATTMLTSSALNDYRKTKKQFGNIDNIKTESIPKTAVRYLGLPFIYGPVLLFLAVIYTIIAIINALIEDARRNRYR